MQNKNKIENKYMQQNVVRLSILVWRKFVIIYTISNNIYITIYAINVLINKE